MDEEEYADYDESESMHFPPQRFSKVTLLRAAVDFLAHVAEGAACALRQIENGVISHEVRMIEERNFADQLAYDLECLPETEEE